MNGSEDSSATKTEETSNGKSLPKDINFKARKKIIREALVEILGKSKLFEKRRLKNKEFSHKKTRERMAKVSRKKNKR